MQELRELPARVAGVELQILQLRDEMRAAFSATRSEIRAGDEETRAFMRAIYERIKEDIKTMGEGKRGRRR